ncbi:hypothetical protein Tco_1046811 [Tanacetum coccineum]
MEHFGAVSDKRIASDLLSSSEAYQGEFVIMVRDLDVTSLRRSSNVVLVRHLTWAWYSFVNHPLTSMSWCAYLWVMSSINWLVEPGFSDEAKRFDSHAASFTTDGTHYYKENVITSILVVMRSIGVWHSQCFRRVFQFRSLFEKGMLSGLWSYRNKEKSRKKV